MRAITRGPDPLVVQPTFSGDIMTVIVNNDGSSEEVYSPGDSFFLPKGANSRWIIYDTISKF